MPRKSKSNGIMKFGLIVCNLMDFSIYIDKISMRLSIVYI